MTQKATEIPRLDLYIQNHPDPTNALQDVDLTGAYLRDFNLRRMNLTKVNFTGADLQNANLDGANLQGANLNRTDLAHVTAREADFTEANLSHADLTNANLHKTNFTQADMHSADLYNSLARAANFTGAILTGANFASAALQEAILHTAWAVHTNFTRANLYGANVAGAHLQGANFYDADLRNLRGRDTWTVTPDTIGLWPTIPPKGTEVTGWKKLADARLAQLLIPADAERMQSTGNKCRASHAQVVAIWNRDGKPVTRGVNCLFGPVTYYVVGKTIYADSWDPEEITCSHGIHFYLSRAEALAQHS